MRKITSFFLLCAGMLQFFAGCQEKPVMKGTAVDFSAIAGNPATRTAYSGEGTYENGNSGALSWERIDWIDGDEILMWSDKATNLYGGGGNSAVYPLTGIEEHGNESWAQLGGPLGSGLHYADEGAHTFWGIYPASAISAAPAGSSLNSVSFSIPESQTGTKEVASDGNITYKPNMDLAVMLAEVDGATPGKKVSVYFYPAFTAFELTFKVDDSYEGTDPVVLHHVTLESTSGLAGNVAATIVAGTRTFTATNNASETFAFIKDGKTYTMGASTYSIPETAPKKVTFNLPEAVQIAKGKELKMTIVTLPQNINDLKIGMHMGADGRDVRYGTLKMKGTDKTVAFAACQKHIIRGVLLKPNDWEFSYITLDILVMDWKAVNVDGISSEFPQATQFAVTGEGVKNGDSDLHLGGVGDNRQKDPYRQQWYFQGGQTVSIFFKIMLPLNSTWVLEPVAGTEDNPVEEDVMAYFSFDDAYTEDVETDALTGSIGAEGNAAIKINITYKGPAGESHSFFFHSYVIVGEGDNQIKYNIDSETQIYDRGRGYHTFFVNNALYNN